MSLETLRGALLWSGIINYGILIFWVVLSQVARGEQLRVARLFGLAPEQFHLIQFAGITLYKMGIFFFNLVPYAALRMVG